MLLILRSYHELKNQNQNNSPFIIHGISKITIFAEETKRKGNNLNTKHYVFLFKRKHSNNGHVKSEYLVLETSTFTSL